MRTLRPIVTILAVLSSCRHPASSPDSDVKENNTTGSLQEQGLPFSMTPDRPGSFAREIFHNLSQLAAASNPGGTIGEVRSLATRIRCEVAGEAERRCRLTYSGPELRLKVADLMFQTMAGHIQLRRGCVDPKLCSTPPVQMWWRSRMQRDGDGVALFDLEVCDVRGIEASADIGQRFALGASLMERFSFKPDIRGFKATLRETWSEVPATDSQGQIRLDSDGKPLKERTVDYQVVQAQGGLGLLGPFPTPHCRLSDDPPPPPPPPAMTAKAGLLPKELLAQAPSGFVKIAIDVTSYLGDKSGGHSLDITVRCQNYPEKPVCELKYRGPQVNIPIPRHVTGIFDGELQILRTCGNPGCKQLEEATVLLTAYRRAGLDHLEFCSLSGFELSTLEKLPLQPKLLGSPNLRGALLSLEAKTGSTADDPRAFSPPAIKKFLIGLPGVGPFPTNRCYFLQ
jgi:hypothetical protein